MRQKSTKLRKNNGFNFHMPHTVTLNPYFKELTGFNQKKEKKKKYRTEKNICRKKTENFKILKKKNEKYQFFRPKNGQK